MKSLHRTAVPSAFGELSIVWWGTDRRSSRVSRVLLPGEGTPTEAGRSLSNPTITKLAEQIQTFLEGNAVNFEMNLIALEECSEFQRRVLLAESKIPRGWVSTYGRIARNVGMPGAARAVGNALASNPFPIIIPCHRAIRSSGELGGFRGGIEMKRALLELEGVEFSTTGRVLTDRFYY